MPDNKAASVMDWTDELLPAKEQAKVVFDNYKRGWDPVKNRQPQWDTNYEAYRTYYEMPMDGEMSELGIPLVFADIDFTITPATLSPGDILDVRITVTADDDGDAGVMKACIGSVQLLCDVR